MSNEDLNLLKKQISLLEQRISLLEQQSVTMPQRTELARRIRYLEKWYDTINTSWWKRVWFVIQGYRFSRLGVWYKARWNLDGQEYC